MGLLVRRRLRCGVDAGVSDLRLRGSGLDRPGQRREPDGGVSLLVRRRLRCGVDAGVSDRRLRGSGLDRRGERREPDGGVSLLVRRRLRGGVDARVSDRRLRGSGLDRPGQRREPDGGVSLLVRRRLRGGIDAGVSDCAASVRLRGSGLDRPGQRRETDGGVSLLVRRRLRGGIDAGVAVSDRRLRGSGLDRPGQRREPDGGVGLLVVRGGRGGELRILLNRGRCGARGGRCRLDRLANLRFVHGHREPLERGARDDGFGGVSRLGDSARCGRRRRVDRRGGDGRRCRPSRGRELGGRHGRFERAVLRAPTSRSAAPRCRSARVRRNRSRAAPLPARLRQWAPLGGPPARRRGAPPPRGQPVRRASRPEVPLARQEARAAGVPRPQPRVRPRAAPGARRPGCSPSEGWRGRPAGRRALRGHHDATGGYRATDGAEPRHPPRAAGRASSARRRDVGPRRPTRGCHRPRAGPGALLPRASAARRLPASWTRPRRRRPRNAGGRQARGCAWA